MTSSPSSSLATPVTAARFPWTALLVLSAGVFLSITAEMLPTGLLPEMSADLGVSEPAIGLLVTFFALTVVLTAAPLTALTRRWPRHRLLVGVVAVLGIATALTAIAPTYPLVVAARVVGGIAHGLFWALVAAYAGSLVPREQIGRAVAITVGGGTLALVLGVPLSTTVGQIVGWRTVFGAVAVLTLLGAVLLWRFLPHVERPSAAEQAAHKARGRDRTLGAVLVVCVVTAITMIGHYALYTYVVPLLTVVVGVDASLVGPLLFGYGLAGALGLVAAGSLLGRRPTSGLVLALTVAGAGALATSLFAGAPLVALVAFFVWGVAFGAVPPLLQTRLLHAASPEIRDVASAYYTTAFNIGIGGGAFLGSVLFETIGIEWISVVYAALFGLAVILVVSLRRTRTRP